MRTFKLEHPYRAAEHVAVQRELRAAAESVAAQLKGNVTSGRRLKANGLDAWQYDIAYGGEVEEITFALDGNREYELLCRRGANASDSACSKLVESFARG